MTKEEMIKVDNNWKEVAKEIVDKCNNLSDFQKALLKFYFEINHEGNKNKIINK